MVMRLFKAMRPRIDLLRAPIRGAFMMEIERMRWRGIPIDMPTYRRAERRAPAVVAKMREELNRKLGAEVYYQNVFKRRTMLQVMRRNGIPIPIDPKTGKESCATKLIKSMIETYPLLKEYYEDKRMIDALKNLKLEIGADGRNRFWLNPVRNEDGAQQSEHEQMRSRAAAHDAVVHEAAAGHGDRAGRLRRGGDRHRRRPVGRSRVAWRTI